MTYVLSVIRMEQLEELGIDTSSASASYTKFGEGDDSVWLVNLQSVDQYPLSNVERMGAFTVTDLLDILPESITSEDGVVHHLSIKKCKVEGWEVSYANPQLFSIATTFLIDAAYSTLLCLIEHGYLKTENTEK